MLLDLAQRMSHVKICDLMAPNDSHSPTEQTNEIFYFLQSTCRLFRAVGREAHARTAAHATRPILVGPKALEGVSTPATLSGPAVGASPAGRLGSRCHSCGPRASLSRHLVSRGVNWLISSPDAILLPGAQDEEDYKGGEDGPEVENDVKYSEGSMALELGHSLTLILLLTAEPGC